MDRLGVVKKLFTNVFVFIAVFLIISTAANVVYLGRNTSKAPGLKGWTGQPDFKVFWIACRNFDKFISDSQKKSLTKYPVYDRRQDFYHFRYSPTIAFLMIPFGKILHPNAALFWWSVLLTFVFLAAFLILRKLISRDFILTDIQRAIILWGAFFGTLRYYLMILGQGQTDVFIALLLVLFLMGYLRNNDVFCGIMFALILHMKPFFLTILLYFLLRKKIKLITSACVAFVAVLLLPSFAVGWNGTIALVMEWKEILGMSVASQLFNFKNQSIPSAIGGLLLKNNALKGAVRPEHLIYSISAGLTLVTYMAIIWFSKIIKTTNEKRHRYLEVSLLIMASVTLSPIAWQAYFVTFIIPFSFTALLILKSKKINILPYAAVLAYFMLSCAVGTDITKFIPGVNSCHFINISLGGVALAFAMIYSYKKTVGLDF